MYSSQPNGAEGATINPATINPAALNPELITPATRGIKRSHSPDTHQDDHLPLASKAPADHGLNQPRKRGRSGRSNGQISPEMPLMLSTASQQQPQQSSPTTHQSQSLTQSHPHSLPLPHSLPHAHSQPAPSRSSQQQPQQQPAPPPPPTQSLPSQQHQQQHQQQQQQQQLPNTPLSAVMTPQTPQSQSALLPSQATAAAGYATAQAQAQAQVQAHGSPPAPPPKTTPTKSTLKALPTVRDHTTDQLGPGGDEYIPREIDDAGEKKVMPNGQLTGSREYKCRTFLVPNRGDKLFMLATECARVLGYRDSYLLFNKNRSLFKIIASQVEKDDLVSQEILPFSYRSRQIAIVTARSMFRQFGSRVIVNGRRVRDDYWESKARKQGFTEADMAGEKRPGGARAREQAAQEANAHSMVGGPHGEIIYTNPPPHFGGPPQSQSFQPGMLGPPFGPIGRIPMITGAPDLADTRSRDYGSFIKGGPRQELTAPAYQDRTQVSPLNEINTQAQHAAEFNRSLNHQREIRSDYMQSVWGRRHDQPASASTTSAAEPALATTALPTSSRPGRSPHMPSNNLQPASMQQPNLQQPNLQQPNLQQPNLQQPSLQQAGLQQQQTSSGLVSNQSPHMMMTAAPYSQSIHSQHQQPAGQNSMRSMPQPMPQPPVPKQHRPPSLQSSGSATSAISQGTGQYSYGSQPQMWNPQTPQAPPQHYSGYTTQAQQSPHPQHSPTPQMRHNSSTPQMQASGMHYPGMSALNQAAYANPAQAMYPPEQTPRQFMSQNPSGTPAATQAWSAPQTTSAGNWWANQPQ